MSLSSSFPISEIYSEDIQQHIFQDVGSQEIRDILNEDLVANGYEIYDHNLHEDQTVSMEDFKNLFPLPQLQPLPTSCVFSNEEYAGPHGFEVSIIPNYKSKNPWVYSPLLNKVYMDMSQQFPVDFKIRNRPDRQLFIRTTPQYCALNYAGDAVCRCIQHEYPADPTNKGKMLYQTHAESAFSALNGLLDFRFASFVQLPSRAEEYHFPHLLDVPEHVRQHVIRCTNKLSHYLGNKQDNQRLSIVFPFSMPQAGVDSVKEMFYFVCKSSCNTPGMNRRGIEVIFTLEDENGAVLGRKSLNVRICACPKRDKEKEEAEHRKEKPNNAPRGKKRKVEHAPASHGKVVAQSEELKEYTLTVKVTGKQNLLKYLSTLEEQNYANIARHLGQPAERIFRKNLLEIQDLKNNSF